MSVAKIEYEVEKNTDREGGVYFNSLEEAVKYYTEQVIFCIEQIKEPTCTDFEIFNHIQLNEHKEDEVIVVMSQDIKNKKDIN